MFVHFRDKICVERDCSAMSGIHLRVAVLNDTMEEPHWFGKLMAYLNYITLSMCDTNYEH